MQGSNCTPLSAALLKEVLKHLPKALDFLHTEANVIHTILCDFGEARIGRVQKNRSFCPTAYLHVDNKQTAAFFMQQTNLQIFVLIKYDAAGYERPVKRG